MACRQMMRPLQELSIHSWVPLEVVGMKEREGSGSPGGLTFRGKYLEP